ncbi:MAG: DUF2157 domain-containing protein [Burkholderiales bacterium]
MTDARAEILAWVREGALPRESLDAALRVTGATPDAAQWRRFVEQLLVWLGAVLMAAALTYFVAANWQSLGRFAKFALVEAALAASVAVACWRSLDSLAGRAALLAAALTTGVLLALVGQAYQTGADTFELFATWAILIVPWTLVGRQPALWLLLVALADLAIVLYFRTNVARGFGALDFVFAPRAALWCVIALNAAALVAWEIAGAARGGWLAVRWAPRLLATSVGAGVTFVAVLYVVAWWDRDTRGAEALAAYAAFAAGMLWAYRVRTLDLYMLAGLAVSAIVLAAFAAARVLLPNGGMFGFLLMALLIAGAAAAAAHALRRLASQAREAAP